MTRASEYLDFLNKKYFPLHKKYEEFFWISYMGDHSVDKKMNEALAKRDAFRSDSKHLVKINELLLKANSKEKVRLAYWKDFFSRFQTPKEAVELKKRTDELESKIHSIFSKRKEGYTDPKTNKFVEASMNKMGTMVRTNPDEEIRKACFLAREGFALTAIDEYIELVRLRNEYAVKLGYSDFYEFKLNVEEKMNKKELFSIFDSIYEKTKYAFENVIKLEKNIPGLRKPWNFGYMMAGDFTKEEDKYFQFDEALIRWGRSFSNLGIDFRNSKLKLDLVDRKGKYNNGFCHWPEVIRYDGSKRIPGTSNFTCNVVYGQVGSGSEAINTLFHEGGHSAHLMNSEQRDVCVNHEYPPMSTAWAETQSMFLDTLFSGIDWKVRYAKDSSGNSYPFELYERKVKKLRILAPLDLYGIMFVINFEKEIYETKDLTKEKVISIAKSIYKKYFNRSEDSLSVLNIPHLYAWESACSYHGYGLATLALDQWREYFYKKYGHIVDNKNVGKEMTKVWKLAASKSFGELVKIATGKKLSADAHIKYVTMPLEKVILSAKKKINVLNKVPVSIKPVKLNAQIKMVHGKQEIANNKNGFENMANKYGIWLKKIINK